MKEYITFNTNPDDLGNALTSYSNDNWELKSCVVELYDKAFTAVNEEQATGFEAITVLVVMEREKVNKNEALLDCPVCQKLGGNSVSRDQGVYHCNVCNNKFQMVEVT